MLKCLSQSVHQGPAEGGDQHRAKKFGFQLATAQLRSALSVAGLSPVVRISLSISV